MSKPVLTAPPTGSDYPGKMLGIVGLIAAILFNLIGLIISAVAYSQSKKAGFKNTPALVGMAVGSVLIGLTIVLSIIGIAGLATYTSY